MPHASVHPSRRVPLAAGIACLAALAVSACAPPLTPFAPGATPAQHDGARTPAPTPAATGGPARADDRTDAERSVAEPSADVVGDAALSLPEPPPEMAQADHVGAAVAAEHFVALVEHGLNALDAAPMLAMCDPANVWCTGMAELIDRTREETLTSSVRLVNDAAVVGEMTVTGSQDGTFVVGLTFQSTTTTTWTDAAGVARTHVGEPASLSLPFRLAHRESGWTVLAVG